EQRPHPAAYSCHPLPATALGEGTTSRGFAAGGVKHSSFKRRSRAETRRHSPPCSPHL
ncbi:MAG: hypothetical protein AVDCRST_MAG68-4463, partial [uncultured Gemmatimonadetes bacterium]